MGKVLVLYFSREGHTRKMAELVASGAASVPETEVRLTPVGKARREDVYWCDGLALGSPTYLGTVSSEMKKFWEDLLPDWHWQNRLEISYNLPKTSLEPTLYGELFTPLNASRPAYFDQKRLGAELSYSLTKKQSIRAGGFYVNVPFQTWRRGVVFQLGWKYSVG